MCAVSVFTVCSYRNRRWGNWAYQKLVSLLDSDGRRYNTAQRRCLLIVCFVLLLRLYLSKTRFTIRADYNLLNGICQSQRQYRQTRTLALTAFIIRKLHRTSCRGHAFRRLCAISLTNKKQRPNIGTKPSARPRIWDDKIKQSLGSFFEPTL